MPVDKAVTPLSISSLRGGQNDTDPVHLLPDDQCVIAQNVEFFYSALGERRLGCTPMTITNSGLTSYAGIVHLSQRFPTNDVTLPEYWAVGATLLPAASGWARRATSGVWSIVTPTDAIVVAVPTIYEIDAQPLHGKHFFAYPSAVDRLHVWDGTTLRRTGLAEPAAEATPTNTGAGAYAATLRYYRVRFIEKSGSVVLRRSEPNTPASITPSGTGTGVVVARPALLSEGETHWELEVSLDNANYYLLATTIVATTTYTDSAATSTYSSGTLSAQIGQYELIPSAKFVAADEDRLVWASSHTDSALKCRVGWTPVYSDPTGSGNDERMPSDVNNTVNLDTNEGGELTGISFASNGLGYAFKWSSVYTLTRTQDNNRAYSVDTISHSRGAIPGSIVDGVDQYGGSCVYFLDPVFGPSRAGNTGLEVLRGLRTTWTRVNTAASKIAARGCYYPDKQQVHWWVAVDGQDTTGLKIVLQVDQVRASTYGQAERGWSLATGRIATAQAVAVFNEIVVQDNNTILASRPVIGLTSPNYIQRCDTTQADAGLEYTALIRTKPYILSSLLGQWGAMKMALLATANGDQVVRVRCIRDFGLESTQDDVTLIPTGSEEFVIKQLQELSMSGAIALQFEFTDP